MTGSAAGQPMPGFVTPQQGAEATYAGQEQKVKNAGAAAQSGIGGASTMRAVQDAGADATTAAMEATSSDQNAAAIARQQIAGKTASETNLSNLISGGGGLLGGLARLAGGGGGTGGISSLPSG